MSDYESAWDHSFSPTAIDDEEFLQITAERAAQPAEPPSSALPSQPAQRLYALIVRLSEFMDRQIAKLEHELVPSLLHPSASETEAAEQQQFHAQREAERRDLAAAIRMEQEQLAEAWKRLEREQREWMLQRGTGSLSRVETTSGSAAGDDFFDLEAATPPTDSSQPAFGAPPNSSEAAERQFMQLKREIRRHTRQESRR